MGTSSDTLRLGGTANASFDVSGIGTQYQGFGSVQKVGASAFTLTGETTALTPWSINPGALIVEGSIASSTLTSVSNGGTLSGIGTVGNLVVNGGGVLAPGSAGAPGIMTVAGNLTFQPASFYKVSISDSSTHPSSANVTGTATLAGTVNATFGSGYDLRRSYNILHADGGLGNTRFGGVSGSLSNFGETLSYTPTDVLLGLTAALGEAACCPRTSKVSPAH